MPRTNRIPTPNEVTDETMMPLTVAAAVAVAHGVISSASAKALKREADQDRLVVYEVFGRLHTTLGDIRTMLRESIVSPRKAGSAARPGAAGAPAPKGVKPKQHGAQEGATSPSKEVIQSLLAAVKPRSGQR